MAGWELDPYLKVYIAWSDEHESWVRQDGTLLGDDEQLAYLQQAAIAIQALQGKNRPENESSGYSSTVNPSYQEAAQASSGHDPKDVAALTQDVAAFNIAEASDEAPKIVKGATLVFRPDDEDDKRKITDPRIWERGVASTTRVSGIEVEDTGQPTDPNYKLRKQGWFNEGRVFKVLWPESAISETSSFLTGQAQRHMTVRWFIVVRESTGFCSCVSAQTYGGQGAAYPGAVGEEHAILHTDKREPKCDKSERHLSLLKPIRVKTSKSTTRIDSMMRVNFGKIYTVDYTVRVFDVGQVATDSMKRLERNFEKCWFKSRDKSGATGANNAEGHDDDDDDDNDDNEQYDTPEEKRVRQIVNHWVRSWYATGKPEDQQKAAWLLGLDRRAQANFVWEQSRKDGGNNGGG